MVKKVLVMLSLSLSFLVAIDVQTASKEELMCIKGIGEKKAEAILKYRKSHKLKSADDLLEIKGFGKVLVENVKKEVKSVACGGEKTSKKSTKKDSNNKKDSSKKIDSDSKKSTKKDSSKKIDSDSKKSTKKDSNKKTDTDSDEK